MNELLSAHLDSVIIGGKLETSWTGLPRKSVARPRASGPPVRPLVDKNSGPPSCRDPAFDLWGDGSAPDRETGSERGNFDLDNDRGS